MPEIMQQQYASLMKDSNSLDCLKYSSPQMERRYIMAIVITNGNYYIYYTRTGATKKTLDINTAYKFTTVADAIEVMKKASGQTKNYYVFDTLTQTILWKWMTHEDLDQIRKNKISISHKQKYQPQTQRTPTIYGIFCCYGFKNRPSKNNRT